MHTTIRDFRAPEFSGRADLERSPHNARALYGRMQSSTRQDRIAEARALAPEIAADRRGPVADLRPDI